MDKIYRRKFAWGTLRIKADFGQATSPVMYSTEDLPDKEQTWASTPFQVASFAHNPSKALSEVNGWTKRMYGN
jgi:hypothetical protein